MHCEVMAGNIESHVHKKQSSSMSPGIGLLRIEAGVFASAQRCRLRNRHIGDSPLLQVAASESKGLTMSIHKVAPSAAKLLKSDLVTKVAIPVAKSAVEAAVSQLANKMEGAVQELVERAGRRISPSGADGGPPRRSHAIFDAMGRSSVLREMSALSFRHRPLFNHSDAAAAFRQPQPYAMAGGFESLNLNEPLKLEAGTQDGPAPAEPPPLPQSRPHASAGGFERLGPNEPLGQEAGIHAGAAPAKPPPLRRKSVAEVEPTQAELLSAARKEMRLSDTPHWSEVLRLPDRVKLIAGAEVSAALEDAFQTGTFFETAQAVNQFLDGQRKLAQDAVTGTENHFESRFGKHSAVTDAASMISRDAMRAFNAEVDNATRIVETMTEQVKNILRPKTGAPEKRPAEDVTTLSWLHVATSVSQRGQAGLEGHAPIDKPSAYGTLGLKENASDKEIKAAYRALELMLHPDRLKISYAQYSDPSRANPPLTLDAFEANAKKARPLVQQAYEQLTKNA